MLTINQADLFYAAEYALAALLLLLCTWQRGTLDIRRQIGRKVFFRRLLLVLFVSVPGIALMTGIYFIRLEPFRCCWCGSILYDSMQQRHSRVFLFPAVPRLSPRVSAGGGTYPHVWGIGFLYAPRSEVRCPCGVGDRRIPAS